MLPISSRRNSYYVVGLTYIMLLLLLYSARNSREKRSSQNRCVGINYFTPLVYARRANERYIFMPPIR